MLVSETNIDDSFPQGQFVLNRFSAPHRLDRNCLDGGLMLFVREDIPSYLLTIEEKPIESFYVELNLCNSKWLVNCSYNPHKNTIGNHLDRISQSLDLLSSDFEKIIFLGDFNVTWNYMKFFCENYGLKDLIRQPACYKNPSNPACIDLILTNVSLSFQSTCVVDRAVWFPFDDFDCHEKIF